MQPNLLSHTPGPEHIHRQWVRTLFNRRAIRGYGQGFLAHEMSEQMFSRLAYTKLENVRWVLDLGSGAGADQTGLLRRFRGARVVSVDCAEQMLMQTRRLRRIERPVDWWRRKRAHVLQAYLEQLPVRSESVDLLWMNDVLQWCEHPEQVMQEAQRVLRPGGLLLFSTLGPNSLGCLIPTQMGRGESAWPMANLIDLRHWGDLLVQQGWQGVVVDVERLQIDYDSTQALLPDWRALNLCIRAGHGLIGRQAYRNWRFHLDQQCVQNAGLRLQADLVYGHAWKSETPPLPELPYRTIAITQDR